MYSECIQSVFRVYSESNNCISSPGPPILCVHGVFGSGKSYLLAVIVLILVRVLSGPQHRILITSTTNVAVDNILIKLVCRLSYLLTILRIAVFILLSCD